MTKLSNTNSVVGQGLALMTCCFGLLQASGQPFSIPDQKFWTPDGPVNAILAVSNTVYLGGNFSYIGPRTGPAASFDQNSGQLLGFPPAIGGILKAIVSDGSGGWFIGGSFSNIGRAAITNLAHLNPDLSLDTTWNASVIGAAVNSLVLDDGRLYVGGQFTRVGGLPLSGLAGLSVTDARVEWNPHLSGTVNAMQIDNGLLYLGGSFSTVGSSNRQNLAAIPTTDTLANAWNPGADAAVLALQVSGPTVFVGGQFLNAGTKPRNRLAALDASTGVASTTWNPNPNGIVRALAVADGMVYVGGDFTTISVANRIGFAVLSSANAAAQPLDLQFKGASTANLVRSLLLEGDSLYVGGQFTSALGELHIMIVKVDLTTGQSLPSPMATDFNGAAGAPFGANALASANGRVFVGGDFISFGGVRRKNAAALSVDSGAALSWAPELDAAVLALAYGSNGVYIGGSFSNVNLTTPARGLALVDPLSGEALDFMFHATNATSAVLVKALALQSNVLYVGGAFTVVNNLARRFVAAIDAASAAPISSFNANLGGGTAGVSSLALAGSSLYLAGDFTTANGGSFSRLTSVSAASGLTNTWNPLPSPNQQINGLSATSDSLYVIGQFTTISGLSLRGFAAYGLSDNSLLPLDVALPSSATLTALSATPTTLYVGGPFGNIGGENRRNLGCLAAGSAGAYDWNPSPDAAPATIALSDNYAFVGGPFRFMGQSPTNRAQGYFAAFQRQPHTTISRVGGDVAIVSTTGDATEAVLQQSSSLTAPAWTDLETNAPGFLWTKQLPATSPQQLFRVIAR